ncbi:helix-turn-helix domain-containing protein [Piscinibacter sakaiensis]|uniref:Putative transcriptional regulator n=1 Tax=Piscinibacter sakaiensis TaxID=1547922 RepID=A0A0K8P2R8_PISS1|nr:helix-turn-helix transcriptional regulator [Piscinibacter sakaiensis]GAP36470.1 putative transcriptional regulator [Piscinibacter sakaiensis]
MRTGQALVTALKAELKAAGITYAMLGRQIGLAESSVKRIFSREDMPLSRVDEVLRVLKLDFADLARRVADAAPLRRTLTVAQERAVVADRRLLLMAICCLSQWTFEQIVETYVLSPDECRAYLAVLDRLGIVESRPLDRYRLRLAKTFRWLPDGPVMAYFRSEVVDEYFAGGFDGEGELLSLVHGEIGGDSALAFTERLQRVAEDFAQQHLADQRLPEHRRHPFTLVIGLRSWLFAPFADMKRPRP